MKPPVVLGPPLCPCGGGRPGVESYTTTQTIGCSQSRTPLRLNFSRCRPVNGTTPCVNSVTRSLQLSSASAYSSEPGPVARPPRARFCKLPTVAIRTAEHARAEVVFDAVNIRIVLLHFRRDEQLGDRGSAGCPAPARSRSSTTGHLTPSVSRTIRSHAAGLRAGEKGLYAVSLPPRAVRDRGTHELAVVWSNGVIVFTDQRCALRSKITS